jgi:hypothetical protein
MMFPISVDPAWYDNYWFGVTNKARSDRKVVARIAIFLVAVCIIGLLGRLALTPQGVTVGRIGFNSTASSSSHPPRLAIGGRQRTSCRQAAAFTLVMSLLSPAQTVSGSHAK